jgi:hypothetical protein
VLLLLPLLLPLLLLLSVVLEVVEERPGGRRVLFCGECMPPMEGLLKPGDPELPPSQASNQAIKQSSKQQVSKQ